MKKFYSLALLATALLFGCTADGVFGGDPHNINYSSGSNPDIDPIGSCTLSAGCVPDVRQSACIDAGGSFSSTGACANEKYCEIYGTGCYKIGSGCGYASESACESISNGYVEDRSYCLRAYGSIDCE